MDGLSNRGHPCQRQSGASLDMSLRPGAQDLATPHCGSRGPPPESSCRIPEEYRCVGPEEARTRGPASPDWLLPGLSEASGISGSDRQASQTLAGQRAHTPLTPASSRESNKKPRALRPGASCCVLECGCEEKFCREGGCGEVLSSFTPVPVCSLASFRPGSCRSQSPRLHSTVPAFEGEFRDAALVEVAEA